MKVAIRVDASNEIGTGHFMRCLTLADAMKRRGVQIRFVSRHMPEHLRDILHAGNHEFTRLSSNAHNNASDSLSHSHWLGTSQSADAHETIQVISDQRWDWIVVDHYALDKTWESVLRHTVNNIMVIDDIADRKHDCEVLLDQNFYLNMNTRYADKVPERCQLLLGPRFALLRDEFRRIRDQVKPRIGAVCRILVIFGGADAENYTGRTVSALASIAARDLDVDVIIGAGHKFREQIEITCADHKFTCHVQTEKIAELMAAADLAIGAGGCAAWERCCMGLPSLAFCVADNQRRQIADSAFEGLLYAPESENEFTEVVKRHVSSLIENPSLRYAMSIKGMQTVDGCGVYRVIGNICNIIVMRAANFDDSQKVFEWRNHPTIRAVSRNSEGIEWESHQRWFASVLTQQDKLLLIGQRDGLPVGVVRFDILADKAEISIFLDPNIKELGIGRELLQSSERWVADNRPTVNKIYAHVLGHNMRAQSLFLGAGYQVESSNYTKRLH